MAEKKEAKGNEPHISGYKKKIVDEFVRLLKEYPIIGAINMENMPAPQLQIMRRKLRGTATIFMTKKRLMKIAIEKCKSEKKGIEKLEPYLKGMPAVLFTKENPFKIYNEIEKNKSKAPAKPGQLAPRDIVVPAGPTPFAPGPVISELSSIGLKTGVEAGKIVIKQDALVVTEGKEINAKVAGILTRLGIEPMEIGLDLVAVYEDGVVYDKKVLAIDEKEFMQNMMNAVSWALNLAVEIGHFTPETTEILVAKAFREAKEVALEGNIMGDMIANELVQKAERQMMSLKSDANITDTVPEAPKEEKKEEKAEEKPAPKPEGPKEESKKEEPKEEKKEEPKVEEKPAPEPKKEEAPKPEPKPEPKVEEKKEEPKIEAPKEEPKPEIKVEEKKEPTPEEKKVWKEVEEVQKDIKHEEKNPDLGELKQIGEKVEKIEENIEKIEEKKEEAPKEELKKEVPKTPTADDIRKVDEEIKRKKAAEAKAAEKRKEVEAGEKLFEQLKKKGTLRKEEVKKEAPRAMTPDEIIKEGVKKAQKKK